MDLKDYFLKTGITQRHFAKSVPYSFQYISLIASKKMVPGKFLAARIQQLTDDKVTVYELTNIDNKKENI